MRSDQEEFVTFVSARLPSLRRAARLLCGDWDRGDDVVQRTLTELYAKWSQAQRADNLDGLVRTMLVRRFLDTRRNRWSRVTLHDEPPDSPAPAEPDVAERLDLYAALARLAPGQRAVLVVRFFYDMTVEQAAEVLGCSTGNIKSQTARGLATLRGLLRATTEREGTVNNV